MSEVMETPRLSAHRPDLTDLRVVVVGCGRSGLAAARLAADRGARVLLSDSRSEQELGAAAGQARDLGATLHPGGNTAELADSADLIVHSPGVPQEIPLIRRARELDLPVWSEIELATRFHCGRVIAVTGSNGKSTVTTMIGDIVAGSGLRTEVGGNLDRPFAELVDSAADDAFYVLELSSFQLENTHSLHADVAVLLNFSADHLDRYDGMTAYADAKARLLDLQDEDAFTVLSADDPASRRFDDRVRGKLHLFSTHGPVEQGAFVREGRMVLRTSVGEEDVFDLESLRLPGEHNQANALAAGLAARLAGFSVETIVRGLTQYRALPHRLEHVRSLAGIEFYNDSKATNPESAACALSSFDSGRVHLILGGKEKGAEWTELISRIAKHARRVLLVGAASGFLAERLRGIIPCVACETIPNAVLTGFRGAQAGDVVLLSPGCASFDQYRNFEERGEDFRQAAQALVGTEGRDDA